MADMRVERMARVLTEYSLGLGDGDLLLINGTTLAADLIRACYSRALALGALPIVQVQLPGLAEMLLTEGSERQIQSVSPVEELLSRQVDAELRIIAEENTRSLGEVDPQRQRMFLASRGSVRERAMTRMADGSLRRSLTLFPTPAHAQDAGMSLRAYQEFVFESCFLNDDDPIARWRELSIRQARMVDWLSARSEIHVTGPDTDLRLSAAGRTWMNSDGKRNFPSGEVFTGPVETSVNGSIRFSYSPIVQSHEISDIRLRFDDGRVVDARAARNEEVLHALLDTDDGARQVGEFAFGTNFGITRFTTNTLFDEKIGGTIHLALGAGYPDSGSRVRSAIHEDLICDLRGGGEVRVDGELFLKDGRYTIE
jgi:aminopeptidase